MAEVAALGVRPVALGADPGVPVVGRRGRRVGRDATAERIRSATAGRSGRGRRAGRGSRSPAGGRPRRRHRSDLPRRASRRRRGSAAAAVLAVAAASSSPDRAWSSRCRRSASATRRRPATAARTGAARRPGRRARSRPPSSRPSRPAPTTRRPARTRWSRPRRRSSRCPGRTCVTSVAVPCESWLARASVDLQPGRRVAAAAEHRQRPLDAEQRVERLVGSVLDRDRQRQAWASAGRRRSRGPWSPGTAAGPVRPATVAVARHDEPVGLERRRSRRRPRRRRRARRARPSPRPPRSCPAAGSGPGRSGARTRRSGAARRGRPPWS